MWYVSFHPSDRYPQAGYRSILHPMRRSVVGVFAVAALGALSLNCSPSEAEGARVGAGAATGEVTGATVRGVISAAALGGVPGAVIGHKMDQQAAELADELPEATVRRVGEGITVTFPGVLFGFDSQRLGTAAQDYLRTLAASLTKYPHTRTLIVGHTDSDGGPAYNRELSKRRAGSAATFIIEEGVDPARIATAGRGAAEPIATNDSDDGRRQNRRLEVAIYTNAGTAHRSGN